MKHRALIFWGVVAVSLIVTALAWDRLPETIDSHWNAAGEADGSSSKLWVLLISPAVLAGMTGLALFLPKIDPLRANIALFRNYFDGFILVLLLFFLTVHVFIVLWNLGIRIPAYVIFPAGLGVILYAVGVLCGEAKRNWFIGIRTPWTLSSDAVWETTHRRARTLFRIAGVIVLASALLGRYAIYVVLAVILALVFYLVIYSYMEFKRLGHQAR
jgi:uncharacterized membrane protein